MFWAPIEDPGDRIHGHLMSIETWHIVWSKDTMICSCTFLPQSLPSLKHHAVSFLYPAQNAMWSSFGNVLGFLWSSGGISFLFRVAYPPGGELCLSSSSYCEPGSYGLLLLEDEACASAAEARVHRLELAMVKKQCDPRDSISSWAAGTNSKE